MEKDTPCELYSKDKMAILIPEEIYFKTKITRNKNGHCIIINKSVNQEDMVILNIYVLIINSKNIKQKLARL